jgi:diacylglycerol kinase (ATP)
MRAVAVLAPGISTKKVEPFRSAGVDVVPAQEISDAGSCDAALIFGGDGSLHRQLLALVNAKLPVLPVPVGSGNDFARSVGICSVDDAAEAWRGFCVDPEQTRQIDIGVIRPLRSGAGSGEEVLFCNIAGAGIDAAINRRANAMPRWLRARGGYVLAALVTIPFYRSQHFEIESRDGDFRTRIRERAHMLALANMPTYGGGMRIAPRARADDGKLDVCLVRHMRRWRLLRLFPRVFRGTHVYLREVESFQAQTLRCETEFPMDVYADGEFACQTPVEVQTLPGALRVIAGRAAAPGC